MGLTILLGILTPIVSSVFGSFLGVNKIHTSIFDLFSSGALNGKALPTIFSMVTDAIAKVCDDKALLEKFKIQLLELCEQGKFKEYEDDYFDRVSARDSYESLVKLQKTPWEVGTLSVVLLVGFVFFVGLFSIEYLVYGHTELKDLFNTAVTTMFTLTGTMVAFWLGSNRATQDHQQVVTALQNSIPAPRSLYQKLRHPLQTAKDAIDGAADRAKGQSESDL